MKLFRVNGDSDKKRVLFLLGILLLLASALPVTAGPSGPVYTSIDVNGTETWADRFILFGGPINVRGTLTITNGFDNGADNSGPCGQNQALIVYNSGRLNADGAILNNSFDSNRTLLNGCRDQQ